MRRQNVGNGQVDKKTTTCIHEKWNLDERNDCWSFDGLNDDRNCVEWREDGEQTQVTSAGSFSLESSGWQKMSIDTRVAADTLTSNFDREGIGDRCFYDWIPDGEAWNFQGYDEDGSPRALDGRLLDAYKVLNSIASASSSRVQEAQLNRVPKVLDSAACDLCCEEQQDFCVKHNGGYMIPTCSKISEGMRIHFQKLLDEYGKKELIPVCLENGTPNLYMNREMKLEETHNLRDVEQYFEKEGQQSGTGMAERIACNSNHNSESRYSIHW